MKQLLILLLILNISLSTASISIIPNKLTDSDGVINLKEDSLTSSSSFYNNSYVVKTGDTMTGNLQMSNNNITGANVLTANTSMRIGQLAIDADEPHLIDWRTNYMPPNPYSVINFDLDYDGIPDNELDVVSWSISPDLPSQSQEGTGFSYHFDMPNGDDGFNQEYGAMEVQIQSPYIDGFTYNSGKSTLGYGLKVNGNFANEEAITSNINLIGIILEGHRAGIGGISDFRKLGILANDDIQLSDNIKLRFGGNLSGSGNIAYNLKLSNYSMWYNKTADSLQTWIDNSPILHVSNYGLNSTRNITAGYFCNTTGSCINNWNFATGSFSNTNLAYLNNSQTFTGSNVILNNTLYFNSTGNTLRPAIVINNTPSGVQWHIWEGTSGCYQGYFNVGRTVGCSLGDFGVDSTGSPYFNAQISARDGYGIGSASSGALARMDFYDGAGTNPTATWKFRTDSSGNGARIHQNYAFIGGGWNLRTMFTEYSNNTRPYIEFTQPVRMLNVTTFHNLAVIQANASTMSCSSTTVGAIYYDGTQRRHYGCNSTDWNAMY